MKRYTSKFLKSVAAFYLGFPVTYLIACAVLFDIPLVNCGRILLSPTYFIIALLGIAVGYGLWEMRRWAWYLMFVTNIMVSYQNAVLVHDYGETHHKVLAYIASLLILAAVMHRVSKEVRVPYFLPKIRWWESNPRYRLSVPVRVLQGAHAVDAEILDLSIGGCFIKLRSDLHQDEAVSLDFTVFGMLIRCTGVVVWRTQSTVTHPRGVGVKFTLTDRAQKRTLRQVNQRLAKIASLYRRSRYIMSQEDFLKRLEELESKAARDSA